MEVSNIMITPATLDDIPKQATLLESKQEVKISVDRFTMTSDVTKKLPKTVNIIDSNFAEHAVDINWTSDNYDRKKTGFFKFIGAPKSLPSGVANVYNIHIEARVFVKPVVIKIELAELVDKARALKSFEYTPDSFLELEIKLKAAEAILQDEFLVQSDVGVGYWQLEGKMNELVSIANTQPLQLVLDDC